MIARALGMDEVIDATVSEPAGSQRDDRAAVEKALSILTALGAVEGAAGLSAIARRASLSKSTAFRLLGTLERSQAVTRVGTDYRLGPLLERLAVAPASGIHEAIRDRFTPFVAELYAQTRETVHLAVLSGVDVVYLNKLHSQRRIATPSRIGGRLPAYATAVGKALLARDADAVGATLAMVRPAFTPLTIIDADRIEHELAGIRHTGVAYDWGECHPDLQCIAAPILGPHGQAVAALSLAGPRGLFESEKHEATLRRITYAASRATLSRGGHPTAGPDRLRIG